MFPSQGRPEQCQGLVKNIRCIIFSVSDRTLTKGFHLLSVLSPSYKYPGYAE